MPSVSKKQHNLMAAVAHSPSFAKMVGIPTTVGKDFMTADKGKKFKEGGTMKHDDMKQDMPMMKKVAKSEVASHEKRMHKMASGGKVGQLSKADGCAKQGKSKGTMIKMRSGGMC
jgi:hypothetical protein